VNRHRIKSDIVDALIAHLGRLVGGPAYAPQLDITAGFC